MFGLGLVRYAPSFARPWIIAVSEAGRSALNRLRLAREGRRAPRGPEVAGRPRAIIGLFASTSGLGQGARLMRAAEEQAGRNVVAVDVTRLLGLPAGPLGSGIVDHRVFSTLDPCEMVLHLNPPAFGQAFLALPKPLRRRSRVIAYWAWELDRVPAVWVREAAIADEIWVPSDFVADSLRSGIPARNLPPIRVVPHPVAALPLPVDRSAENRAAVRAALGIGPNDLTIGFSFSMSSNFARKNPMGAVAAFRAAFPGEEANVRFVMRMKDEDIWPRGAACLRAAAAGDGRIILCGDDRPLAIGNFYEIIDLYLALHRGEGYGLNIAESALFGIPALVTGWGLAADIQNLSGVTTVESALTEVHDPQRAYRQRGARWAEPDHRDAVAKLRRLADGLRAMRDGRR